MCVNCILVDVGGILVFTIRCLVLVLVSRCTLSQSEMHLEEKCITWGSILFGHKTVHC